MQAEKVLFLYGEVPFESGKGQNWIIDGKTSFSNQFCFDSSKAILKHTKLLHLSEHGKGNMAGVKMHMSRMFLCCR